MAIGALIIDDSPFARSIIRHHLIKIGLDIAGEAENAARGLAMFRESGPRIVTMDVMMPAVDGVDSAAAFRAIRRENSQAAIIVVSAVPFEKTRQTFLDEGAIAYVVKPFNKFSFEPVRQKLIRIFPELAA